MSSTRCAIVALLLVGVGACGSVPIPECTASTQCTFEVGGQCKAAATGHSWCQYPDATCTGGIRWSSEAGDNLASVCVAAHKLQVTKQGTGGGNVMSSPSGVNCGPTCAAMEADGTAVTLTAAPDSASVFAGWGGDALSCGTSTVCALTIAQMTNAMAVFNKIPRYDLAITKVGAGLGGVTSAPGGIDCGSICQDSFQSGTSVTLTAAVGAKATFGGWGGTAEKCGLNLKCTVAMDKANAVTATFIPIPDYSIAIMLPNDGSGRITSSPAGIDCGAICLGTFARGTSVKLTATVDPGSTWGGWGGEAVSCGLNLTCTISLNAAKSITAAFSKVPIYQLTVAPTGNGVGGISSAPSAITCGESCTAAFPANTAVTLTIDHDPTSVFTGWFGDASSCGVAPTCTFSMTANKQVGARFSETGTTLWLTHLGGTASDQSRTFAVDMHGDIFVAGVFGSAQFNAGTFPLTNHGTVGSSDIFLAKLSRDDGHVIWAKAFGGAGVDDVASVAVDPSSGDVFLFASYIGDSDFGDTEILAGNAIGDWVIARYSGTNGGYQWSRRIVLSNFNPGYAQARGRLGVGATGLYVAGFWSNGSIDLGDGPRLSNHGYQSMFVAKYSLNGPNLSWGKDYRQAAGQPFGWIEAHGIAVDGSDNVVVVGKYAGSVDVGDSHRLLTSTSSPIGDREDGFLTKFAGTDGSLLWARSVGGASSDSCDSVAIGPSNDVIVACNDYIGDGTLTNLAFGGTASPVGPAGGPTGANELEVVVARYSSVNEYKWARRFGGDKMQQISGVGVDSASGQVLVGGLFSTVMAVDGFSLVRTGVYDNAWVAALAPDTGVAEWAQRFAGLYAVGIDAIAADGVNGRVLVNGSFASLAQFGDQEAMSAGDGDVYVVSIIPSL